MSNYGQIDILWYDVSWPFWHPEGWQSKKMNAMVRALQPRILINNRSQLPEDFGTPEERIQAAEPGRAWEACMTFNGSWGYMPSAVDWRSVREVIGMLRTCAAGGGNLLLNIGPAPDGSVPPEAVERLRPVGRWLRQNGEAVYGRLDRCEIRGLPCGSFSQRGKVAYWWVNRWPGKELAAGGFKTKLRRASVLATGEPIAFEQTARRIVLKGLPEASPDPIAGVAVLKLEFASRPRREQGCGYVVLKDRKGKII
jgi:alpha-L-fucosidase